MKTHITIKSIRQNWGKKFYCGYCDLQDIMRYTEPTYYNAGVYGWNCDIYTDFSRDIAITTGYRNMTGKRIPDELIGKYSNIANAIVEQNRLGVGNFEQLKAALELNKERFLDELAKI